jgi:hypothetical protein
VIIGDSLPMLERLDVSFSLSSHYAIKPRGMVADDERHLYYNFTLPECVEKLELLVRLDIGDSCEYETEEGITLSHRHIAYVAGVLHSRGGHLTQSAETVPPFWPNSFDETTRRNCRLRAIENIVQNTKIDADVRNVAYIKLQSMKKSLNVDRNEDVVDTNQPVAVIEDLGDSPMSSNQEMTVASNSSNKRRHDEMDTPSDSSKVPRLP